MKENKEEYIEFLIKKCYKKFPELMEQIPEEAMYKILRRNILKIQFGGKNNCFSGMYWPILKKLDIYNYNSLSVKDIENNEEIISTLSHEGVHALATRYLRGSGTDFIYKQFNIKGFLKKSKIRLKSSKNFLDHLRVLSDIMEDLLEIRFR